jgi:hypothetical protein
MLPGTCSMVCTPRQRLAELPSALALLLTPRRPFTATQTLSLRLSLASMPLLANQHQQYAVAPRHAAATRAPDAGSACGADS